MWCTGLAALQHVKSSWTQDLTQFSSVVQSCPTLCDPMNHSMPGLPVHHQLLESTQTHVHCVGDVIQPSHPLSSPSLPAPIPPSIRVFSNESTLLIRWPKYWSFSFCISLSSEYSHFISFRMDWLDLLEVQGTLKILLQHHSSKASILQCSTFFMVQISHPYMTTGKTIALRICKDSVIQFSHSVVSLCHPMNCSPPGFPVHHKLPELIQTHVHQVGDAIQSSYPLSSSSPPAFNLAQHQGLFQ